MIFRKKRIFYNNTYYKIKKVICVEKFFNKLSNFLSTNLYFCKSIHKVPVNSIVFFPINNTVLNCGLAGMISYKFKKKQDSLFRISDIDDLMKVILQNNFHNIVQNKLSLETDYLGGKSHLNLVKTYAVSLKNDDKFSILFKEPKIVQKITDIISDLSKIIKTEEKSLHENMGVITTSQVDAISNGIEEIKDIFWCLKMEVIYNIEKIKKLITKDSNVILPSTIKLYKIINSTLNSIDRLEVRGRDSSGISILFNLEDDVFATFYENIENIGLKIQLNKRTNTKVLFNNDISINTSANASANASAIDNTIIFTYKVAAEIGSLGDNVKFLRNQIKNDQILQIISLLPYKFNTVFAHTRWASVGSITEANCHPVDNDTANPMVQTDGLIHACLNGDIDNYLELKEEFEDRFNVIQKIITTDTKIIPLQIELYLKQGHNIESAFLMAVNDFEGSHAILMHTDLAPGKLFLAQKGSGQAIFVGIGEEQYFAASEVYGFVEETNRFIKMDGEIILKSENGDTNGQIFILDQNCTGGLDGIKAMYYNGTKINLTDKDIQTTQITSRDIDRQDFKHYFLKEISEAPLSVAKTIQNRWKVKNYQKEIYVTALEESVIPKPLEKQLSDNIIKRIFFMGQGTAGVAALTCSNILKYYINDPLIQINALKSSELSGFILNDNDKSDCMEDTLVVAISQSGTTTDTNRTVDMVKLRGAKTLAIVNRRDSDLTFKVDGVIYTSSGRDIEMSVASTKAFYSQIVAGAILGLHIAGITKYRDEKFISDEIKNLLKLSEQMNKVLLNKDLIQKSAQKLTGLKLYWATVGSGPNKAAADEIRIKLSELCYKTISSDFVEDKKHIDLSSEPLIIISAAGTRESVITDIVKDTAIFHAHKAIPIVIVDEGETRFNNYAKDIFYVPKIKEHLAPILNTLTGHLWGYYAALTINDGSKFFYKHQQKIQNIIDEYTKKGLDMYEVILEKKFREQIARLYTEFKTTKINMLIPSVAGAATALDITLLLKYLIGRLPVSDFEFDFGKKGTPVNMLNCLFDQMGDIINAMARPVDAIKHQAKTVTVGTSRISTKIEGVLFEQLFKHDIGIDQLTNRNVIVLKNLQDIVKNVKGSVLYKIDGLSLLGEITNNTKITIIKKSGILKNATSRIETDNKLKGTKNIIVREGNIFVGKGRKDGREIMVIPVISSSSEALNKIEYLLSLNIEFQIKVPLFVKIKAYGAKLERLKNIVQENNVKWDDNYLNLIKTDDLFGDSADKTGDIIILKLKDKKR